MQQLVDAERGGVERAGGFLRAFEGGGEDDELPPFGVQDLLCLAEHGGLTGTGCAFDDT